nr:unnamed protein product [Haemonchus contortus]
MPWPVPSDSRSILNRVDNIDTKHLNRMMIVDANYRASQLFRAAGYDVLDISFYMRNQALYAYRVFYEALRRDISTMRVFALLEDHPEIEKRLDLEDNWVLREMAEAFPNVAKYIGGVVPQEVTVMVDEEALNRLGPRKRKHSPDPQ